MARPRARARAQAHHPSSAIYLAPALGAGPQAVLAPDVSAGRLCAPVASPRRNHRAPSRLPARVLDHPSARTSLGPGGANRVRPNGGFFKIKFSTEPARRWSMSPRVLLASIRIEVRLSTARRASARVRARGSLGCRNSRRRLARVRRLDCRGEGLLARGSTKANRPSLTRMYGPAARCKRFLRSGRYGLASMYPASAWSVLCSGPSWISARMRSH
jgi:hypothetical protein